MCMPNVVPGRLMQQPLRSRIVISNELALFLRAGRIETRLHIAPQRSSRIAFRIKPRKVSVPDTLPARAVFVPSGAFSGWFEIIEHRPNTYAIVDDARQGSTRCTRAAAASAVLRHLFQPRVVLRYVREHLLPVFH